MTQKRKKGQFASPWNGETTRVRLPFSEDLKTIALIADKHPQPQRFLDCVAKVAKELAIADGVNLID
jgi:hypothetical protein